MIYLAVAILLALVALPAGLWLERRGWLPSIGEEAALLGAVLAAVGWCAGKAAVGRWCRANGIAGPDEEG